MTYFAFLVLFVLFCMFLFLFTVFFGLFLVVVTQADPARSRSDDCNEIISNNNISI